MGEPSFCCLSDAFLCLAPLSFQRYGVLYLPWPSIIHNPINTSGMHHQIPSYGTAGMNTGHYKRLVLNQHQWLRSSLWCAFVKDGVIWPPICYTKHLFVLQNYWDDRPSDSRKFYARALITILNALEGSAAHARERESREVALTLPTGMVGGLSDLISPSNSSKKSTSLSPFALFHPCQIFKY